MQRTIRLVHLKNGYTQDFLDDDQLDRVDKVPTGERQALIRNLQKRVKVKVDDVEVELPLFRLAEIPSINDGEFDKEYLKYDGDAGRNWILPSQYWLDFSAKLQGKREEKQALFAKSLVDRAGADLARSLTELVETKNLSLLASQKMSEMSVQNQRNLDELIDKQNKPTPAPAPKK